MQIILKEQGTKRAIKNVDAVEIPDLWHHAMSVEDEHTQRQILECWHTCHDLKRALQTIQAMAIEEVEDLPIHTDLMDYAPQLKSGDNSPWGPIQSVEVICLGIEGVCTASHGGIWLDESHAKLMPEEWVQDSFLHRRNWYEEDCDWCLPFVRFEEDILCGQVEAAAKLIANGNHRAAMVQCHSRLSQPPFAVPVS